MWAPAVLLHVEDWILWRLQRKGGAVLFAPLVPVEEEDALAVAVEEEAALVPVEEEGPVVVLVVAAEEEGVVAARVDAEV